jgi:hypothetical protein
VAEPLLELLGKQRVLERSFPREIADDKNYLGLRVTEGERFCCTRHVYGYGHRDRPLQWLHGGVAAISQTLEIPWPENRRRSDFSRSAQSASLALR